MSIQQPPGAVFSWPIIDKSLPRPAPTEAYSWKEYNSTAKLLYIRDHVRANDELSKLNATVLGFDLEWKPIYYKGGNENPVALVQLASYDTVLLLQISAMKEFPSKLEEILANSDIVKAGVAIQNDVLKLYNDCCVSVYNCVDLSLLARTVDNARWQGKYNHPLGLARLIESYEYRILVKGKITRSNWEAILNERQQEYASNDAHAGLSLYTRLEKLLSSLQTPPERGWYAFDAVNGQLCQQDGTQWNAENPNYDPGPPPPPRLPREVNVSMIISTESNAESKELEPSATKARNTENRFQRRRRDRNHLPLSTSQQPSAGSPSGSTQQLQHQGHCTYNPQSLPKNSGNTVSQHRATGAQDASSTPCRCRVSSPNIRNEQVRIDNGYRRPRHRFRPPASQDTATTTRS